MDYNQTRSFNVGLAQETSIEAALIFDELSFLFGKTSNKNGLLYKSAREIELRLPMLSVMTIRRSIQKLKDAGYIEVKIMKAGGAPTMHFKILKQFGIVQNEQMDSTKMNKSIDSTKMNKSITATNKATNKQQRVLAYEYLPSGLYLAEKTLDAMQDFIDDRKERKKPMTGRAVTLALKKLHGWYPANADKQVECINQSIEKGWMGLFQLQNGSFNSNDTANRTVSI